MPLVALDHVSLAFGHLPLLDDATLQIERGERVSVVGRNGAGKSTLLRIVSGEQPPDAGTVWTRAGPAPRRGSSRTFRSRPIARSSTSSPTALGDLSDLVARYHHTAVEVAEQQHAGAARETRAPAARARASRRLAHRTARRARAVAPRPAGGCPRRHAVRRMAAPRAARAGARRRARRAAARRADQPPRYRRRSSGWRRSSRSIRAPSCSSRTTARSSSASPRASSRSIAAG